MTSSVNTELLANALDWILRSVGIVAILISGISFLKNRLGNNLVRKFFGGRNVEIYLPLRTLEDRKVIAEPDYIAAKNLEIFLHGSGITTTINFIDNTDRIDLSAGGVVAICGPKSSKFIASAMMSEPNLQFIQEGGLWGIRDSRRSYTYFSPGSKGEEGREYGYLSRLSSSKSNDMTFLSIAGIHAEGSAIAVDYITNIKNLRDINRRVGINRFSSVVSGDYLDNPLRATTSKLEIIYRNKQV